MRRKISAERVSKLWKQLHPKARKPPPCKAYFVPQSTINRIAEQSARGKGKLYQTKEEYGTKFVPNGWKTDALIWGSRGETRTILVKSGMGTKATNYALKHELSHITRR